MWWCIATASAVDSGRPRSTRLTRYPSWNGSRTRARSGFIECGDPQPRQPLVGFPQRLVTLREAEPHGLRRRRGIVVEAAARHGRDADFLHEVVGKLRVGREAEPTDIGNHVVSDSRRVARKAV